MKRSIYLDLNGLPVEENSINAQHEKYFSEEQSQNKKPICEEPFVGRSFLSEEGAHVFYQHYARKNGFSVRKGRFVNKKGERKRRDFFCHREVKTECKNDYTKTPRIRGYARCKCKAHMRITLRRINEIFPEEWQVTKFVTEHNHALLSTQEVDLAIEDVGQKQIHDTMLAKYQECCLTSLSPLEKQGYKVLTLFAFKKFQDQFALAIQYSTEKENDTSFIVKHYKAARWHKVIWDGKMAKCTCKNFEFVGIFCRHVLNVLLHMGCFVIPSNYWLSRWSWEETQFNEVTELHQKRIFDVSSSCGNNTDLVTNAIELVQCPVISKTKGRPKQNRTKSGKELARQVKRCRLCKSSTHNFSTCPDKRKLEMESKVDCNPIFHFKC